MTGEWVPGDPVHPDQAAVRTTCGRCGTSWTVDLTDCPICPPLTDPPGEPADGHLFEIRVHIRRGAYTVVGQGGVYDGETWHGGPVGPVQVRAHNLPDALRAAAALELRAWFGWLDEDEHTEEAPDAG